MIAMRSIALHSCGLYHPPGNKTSRNCFSSDSSDEYSVLTSIGPVKLGGIVGHVFKPNVVISFVKKGLFTLVCADTIAVVLELGTSLRPWCSLAVALEF